MVGQTERGEQIVEVRSVRLVLRGDANHFSRLVTCTNCGREVPGLPVTSPTDLDVRPGPYVCTDCVEALRAQGAPSAAPAAPAAADDGAMERLQARVDELAGSRLDPLDARLGQLEERMAASAGADRLEALDIRLDQLDERLAARDGAGRFDTLDGRLERVAADAAAGADRLDALDVRLEELTKQIAVAAAGADKRAQALDVRLKQLEQQVAATASADDKRAQALDRLTAQLETRMAQLEAAAEAAATTLHQAIDERLAVVEGRAEAQRLEAQTALANGLDEVRAAAAMPAGTLDRLHALEKQATRSGSEMSELGELHAALDAGLGVLRAEIGDVRSSVKRVADGHAELDDRLETYVRVSMSPDDQGKGRRSGRKGGDGDRVTTMAAAIDDILREQRVLREHVASLAQATDAATATAGRAASQASALSPLRSEIKLLHQEIAEQNEALEALRKAAERPPPPPPPPPPPAPAATKAPAAKKVTRAKKA